MKTLCKACGREHFDSDDFMFCSSCTEAGWGIAYERGFAAGRVAGQAVGDGCSCHGDAKGCEANCSYAECGCAAALRREHAKLAQAAAALLSETDKQQINEPPELFAALEQALSSNKRTG